MNYGEANGLRPCSRSAVPRIIEIVGRVRNAPVTRARVDNAIAIHSDAGN